MTQMNPIKKSRFVLLGVALLASVAVWAQGGPPPDRGPGAPDMKTIHQLFANNTTIKRNVKNLPNGIEAVTESTDPKMVKLLQEHVAAMKKRLEKKEPIRQWDPLFAVLFEHADKVKMTIIPTKMGVKIVETSKDAYVVKLLQSHSQAVSGFVKDGMAGMHKSHPAPSPEDKAAVSEPAFLGKGDGVKTCPVTGEPVDATITTNWKGKTVKFCCSSCVVAFQKSPERYLRP